MYVDVHHMHFTIEQVMVTLNPLLFSLREEFAGISRISRPHQSSPSRGSNFSTYLTDIKNFDYFTSIYSDLTRVH